MDEVLGDVTNCYGKTVRIGFIRGGAVIYGAFDKFRQEATSITSNSISGAVSEFLGGPSNYGLLTAGKFKLVNKLILKVVKF